MQCTLAYQTRPRLMLISGASSADTTSRRNGGLHMAFLMWLNSSQVYELIAQGTLCINNSTTFLADYQLSMHWNFFFEPYHEKVEKSSSPQRLSRQRRQLAMSTPSQVIRQTIKKNRSLSWASDWLNYVPKSKDKRCIRAESLGLTC
jgi:hypothetical protein